MPVIQTDSRKEKSRKMMQTDWNEPSVVMRKGAFSLDETHPL